MELESILNTLKNTAKQAALGVALAAGFYAADAAIDSSNTHAQDIAMMPAAPCSNGTCIIADPEARVAVYATNIALNSAICGISAAIDGRDVLQDITQCMLGASIQSVGMELGMYDAPVLPGFAMRAVETGTSIIENTLAGEDMFSHLRFSLGPVMMDINTEDSTVGFYWQLFPIGGIIANIVDGNNFSLIDTLNYQTMMFTAGEVDGNRGGYTMGNVVAYEPGHSLRLRSHEFDHVLQYIRGRPLQLLLNETPIVGEAASWLEENVRLRLGADVAYALANLPQTVCNATGNGTYCGIPELHLSELEAYIQQTGYDTSRGE